MGSAARSGIGVAILVRIGKSPRLALRTKLGPLSSWPTCVPTSLIVAGCSSLSGPIMCWLRRVLCRITISSHRPCRAPTASSSSSARPRRLRPRRRRPARVLPHPRSSPERDRVRLRLRTGSSASGILSTAGRTRRRRLGWLERCFEAVVLDDHDRSVLSWFEAKRGIAPPAESQWLRGISPRATSARAVYRERLSGAGHGRVGGLAQLPPSPGRAAVATLTLLAERIHRAWACSALPPPGPARGLERPPVEGPPLVGPEAHRVGQCPSEKLPDELWSRAEVLREEAVNSALDLAFVADVSEFVALLPLRCIAARSRARLRFCGPLWLEGAGSVRATRRTWLRPPRASSVAASAPGARRSRTPVASVC